MSKAIAKIRQTISVNRFISVNQHLFSASSEPLLTE